MCMSVVTGNIFGYYDFYTNEHVAFREVLPPTDYLILPENAHSLLHVLLIDFLF